MHECRNNALFGLGVGIIADIFLVALLWDEGLETVQAWWPMYIILPLIAAGVGSLEALERKYDDSPYR